MSFYAKLAGFWVIVYAEVWLLARFPNSRVSRLAFSWQGPISVAGERKSEYLFRWAVCALGWLAQIAFVFAVGYLIAWWRPWIQDEWWFLAIWAFALPLLGGIAILGALGATLRALWAKLIGPNPTAVELESGGQA